MRGTILLIDRHPSPAEIDLWRANGLIVHHSDDLAHALQEFPHTAPDVIVVVAPAQESEPIVSAMRRIAGHATSIIVTADPGERDAARRAGADSFVAASSSRAELLYEIHRALILRRSGRRLPWG